MYDYFDQQTSFPCSYYRSMNVQSDAPFRSLKGGMARMKPIRSVIFMGGDKLKPPHLRVIFKLRPGFTGRTHGWIDLSTN